VTRTSMMSPMARNRWLPKVASVFALVLCWPAIASAQMAEAGVARDAKTGAPLECLHVVLADSADRAIAHTVTDSAGRFMLEAPRPGAYRVRFEIYGWESLMGPLDTLAEADFKQRRYPLEFTGILLPKDLPRRTVLDSAESVRAEHDRQEREAYKRFYRELHSRADSMAWRSRVIIPDSAIRLQYPRDLFRRGLQGSVVAQVIIDSTGKARSETWQPLRVAHRDFEKAVRSVLDDMRWHPAILEGHPSCELTRSVVEFSLDFSSPSVKWAHIVWMY
jgi:Carboxypeptidase regulatory-like domain